MADDLLLRDLERGGDFVPRRLGILRACPDLAAVGRHVRHGCRRLHGRLGQVRCVVLGGHLLSGTRQCGRHVTLLAHDASRSARRRLQCGAIRLGVVGVVRARRPCDLERAPSLHGRPRAACDHCHAAQRLEARGDRRGGQRDDPLDARHLQRRRGIDGGDARAVHGRMEDHGDLHPGHLRVLPEGRPAREDRVHVESGDILADEPELRRILEPGCGGNRERARSGDEPAERQRASRRRVHHGAVARADLGFGHAPLRCSGAFQHLACGCASGTEHRVLSRADARGTVGVLVAVFWIADRLFEADRGPVGLELVGDHHAQRRAHALPHLGAVAGHGDQAIFADAQVYRRLERVAGGEERRQRLEPADARRTDGEHETAGGEPAQEIATLEIGWSRHGQRPPADAATIAARMRVYVPHRQITADIA